MTFENTTLWQRTLAGSAPELERLRTALRVMREHAADLAGEIAKELPEFTVHDKTHLDALWDTGSLVVGPSFNLNPLEGFIYGAACLIHDIGMGLAAYPGGLGAIRQDKAWNDTVVAHLTAGLEHRPSAAELAYPPDSIIQLTIAEILRLRHAETAATLCQTQWQLGKDSFYLIEDVALRESYGEVIGKIGASHNWDLSDVETSLSLVLGSAVGFPAEWTIDQLKLACLLRVADAAQIDSRRAPSFLMALRKPKGVSQDHWQFQRRMNQPHVEGDRLVFTSTAFPRQEARAWWLSYETLQMIDRELRHSDQLLLSSGRPRLAVSGVAYIEAPHRLARAVPTDGWNPVDATIRITNVDNLVKQFGGSQLYGQNELSVPLRELVQNASDAVRARRIMERRSASWGRVVVRLAEVDSRFQLTVEDTGIGMSQAVMTGPLIDFGRSYWVSSLVRAEWPGLTASPFRPAGRYGIGFFSVFMLGRKVTVISRRPSDRPSETRVLEFPDGTADRPMFRLADPNEYLLEPGTRVTVELDSPPLEASGLLKSHPLVELRGFELPKEKTLDSGLADMLKTVAPTLDVDLSCGIGAGESRSVVEAGDWTKLSPKDFLARIEGSSSYSKILLRPILNEAGQTIGRLATAPSKVAVIVSEGLATGHLGNVEGAVEGEPMRLARDWAKPKIGDKELREWSKEQVRLIRKLPKQHQAEFASLHAALGVNVSSLAIAWTKEGWLNEREIRKWASSRSQVYLGELDDLRCFTYFGPNSDDRAVYPHDLQDIDFDDDTIVAYSSYHGLPAYSISIWRMRITEDRVSDLFANTTSRDVLLARVEMAVSASWKGQISSENVEEVDIQWGSANVTTTFRLLIRNAPQTSLPSVPPSPGVPAMSS